MTSAYDIFYPQLTNVDGTITLNGEMDFTESFGQGGPYGKRTKAFGPPNNNDVTGTHGIPMNSYIYAGNIYKFDRYGNTSSIQFNESIKQDFMNEKAYSSFVNLGKDGLCKSFDYDRAIFGNFIVDGFQSSSGIDSKLILCVMNPKNSGPFIENANQQLVVYLCIAMEPGNIGEFIENGDILNHIGKINTMKMENINSSSGNYCVYPIPHFGVLVEEEEHTNFIYQTISNILGSTQIISNPQLTEVEYGNFHILGAQTYQTCSIGWAHVHALAYDSNSDSVWSQVTENLRNYQRDEKFIIPTNLN